VKEMSMEGRCDWSRQVTGVVKLQYQVFENPRLVCVACRERHSIDKSGKSGCSGARGNPSEWMCMISRHWM
jgi:hypothetical protein